MKTEKVTSWQCFKAIHRGPHIVFFIYGENGSVRFYEHSNSECTGEVLAALQEGVSIDWLDNNIVGFEEDAEEIAVTRAQYDSETPLFTESKDFPFGEAFHHLNYDIQCMIAEASALNDNLLDLCVAAGGVSEILKMLSCSAVEKYRNAEYFGKFARIAMEHGKHLSLPRQVDELESIGEELCVLKSLGVSFYKSSGSDDIDDEYGDEFDHDYISLYVELLSYHDWDLPETVADCLLPAGYEITEHNSDRYFHSFDFSK